MTNLSTSLLARVAPLGTPEILLVLMLIAVLLLVVLLPCWRICQKAGFTPWLSLLVFVPFGAVVFLFILAFMDWPALKKNSSPS